jgi:ribosomal subunit interface protein
MQIKYRQKGVVLSDKNKTYLEEKIQKLEKFFKNKEEILEIEVEKDKQGFFLVEMQIRGSGQHYLAREKAEVVEVAGDLVVEQLKSQINKEQKKKRTLFKRGTLSLKKLFSIDKGARF